MTRHFIPCHLRVVLYCLKRIKVYVSVSGGNVRGGVGQQWNQSHVASLKGTNPQLSQGSGFVWFMCCSDGVPVDLLPSFPLLAAKINTSSTFFWSVLTRMCHCCPCVESAGPSSITGSGLQHRDGCGSRNAAYVMLFPAALFNVSVYESAW